MLNEYMNNYMNRAKYIKKKTICDIYCKFIKKNFKHYTKLNMSNNNISKLIIINVFDSSLFAIIEEYAIKNIKFNFIVFDQNDNKTRNDNLNFEIFD